MSALGIASIFFVCTVCAGLLGCVLHTKLPEQQRETRTTDVVKLVMGLIATASALILGLLIASAQSSYNTQRDDLEKMAADTVEMDRLLAFYGSETQEARVSLRQVVIALHDAVWLKDNVKIEDLDPVRIRTQADKLAHEILNLTPKTESQRAIFAQVTQLALNLAQLRLLLFQHVGGSISPPFLILLIFWTSILFLGFGLLSRLNTTIVATFLVGALSVSAAMFIILELDRPYGGFIQLSDVPLREALAQLGQQQE
jgi:hypothetical protein